MPKIHGICDPRFAAVEQAFQANVDSGVDLGASIVVNIDGKNVVDLWGGWADAEKTREWEENTITNVWSSSKTVLSLAMLVLVERGQLDLYEKVSKYWPEFAANGKENIEVRHLISHTSGLSGWEESLTLDDLYDTKKSTAALAAQAPWWTPGTASGYHSLTMGHLVGELVLRVTGKSLTQFIREDLAGPLNADFQIGVQESDLPRVSDVIPPTGGGEEMMKAAAQAPLFMKTLMNPALDANVANSSGWRSAEIGAANGHTNARGIARLLSAVTNGGSVDGVKLLSPATIDKIFEEQAFGRDQAMGYILRFGIGYGLAGKDTEVEFVPEGKTCFWGGYGGSVAIMDVGRGVTITYMMNKMSQVGLGNDAAKEYTRAVYKALGVE